ncbi:MAG TPA: radical SAM family heme chaperone HemW [Anaerolineales bacterium]|nr:radical SAM family heme chaperone HemW [Anaerolineales bacterium]
MHSLYIHIPFCTHRCAYCDFNTYAGQEAAIPAYVEALCREIQFTGRQAAQLPDSPINVHTIFFGGGTPSLLSPEQFGAILKTIRASFVLTEDAEITIEANPGTVSYENLLQLRRLGVNRISFGVQSANMEELRMLERTHTFFDVIEAVASARRAGFDNLNLDLIYGLPEQNLKTWQTTVKRILDLHPEHISAYALTLEHGTPFGRWSAKGLLPLPDPDLAADMYEWAGETFEAYGYLQYEISNWAKHIASSGAKRSRDAEKCPGFACRHNLQYWRGLPYLAFGAGAHGYARGYRYSNVLRIKTYIDRLADSPITNYSITNYPLTNYQFPLTPAVVNHHKQSLQDDMSEFMMTGLRLTQEGVSESEFQARFGMSMRHIYEEEIDQLLQLGLLEWEESVATNPARPSPQEGRGGTRTAIEVGGDRVKLSQQARLLANQVFMRFVG